MSHVIRCLSVLCWTALLVSCSLERDDLDDQVPRIEREGSRLVVLGCDGELDRNAKGACPWVRCEAAILHSREVELLDEIKLQSGPSTEDGSKQLIVGTATSPRPDGPQPRFVHCLIQDERIVRAGVITERQYNAARYDDEWL